MFPQVVIKFTKIDIVDQTVRYRFAKSLLVCVFVQEKKIRYEATEENSSLINNKTEDSKNF